VQRLCRASHPGFTLVELLVVITIIGILISLLLPAVQAAREAARRISCSNNLRQMGIGMHNYHCALRSFPPGGIEPRIGLNAQGRQMAWSAMLLPYIEQQPLYEKIDFRKAFDAPENADAAAMIVATYVCPSAPGQSQLRNGRGPTDYGGIFGQRITGPNSPPKGTMLYNYAVTIGEITDGTSTTLIVAEDSNWPDGQWINGLNIFDQAYAINFVPPPGYVENEIRSKHPGGANGLFCDGSVRFLMEQMAVNTLAAICTRSGGELVGEF
jgi:prepilin-type N-terminal cleavage/methylation domain-containing protein/prepilin-type processing-associated H-X9-DG protein